MASAIAWRPGTTVDGAGALIELPPPTVDPERGDYPQQYVPLTMGTVAARHAGLVIELVVGLSVSVKANRPISAQQRTSTRR